MLKPESYLQVVLYGPHMWFLESLQTDCLEIGRALFRPMLGL
jgi:hypothetical protein